MKLSFLILMFYSVLNTVLGQNKSYISTEKAILDLEYMIKTIEEVHYNPYFKVKKEVVYQSKEALIADFDRDSIPLKQFVAAGMKIAAQMSGGHTMLDWQSRGILTDLKTEQFIPFTGELVGEEGKEQFVVTRSAIPEIKKGALIESINGIGIVELYEECQSYFGGLESFKNTSSEKTLPMILFFIDKVTAPYHIKWKGLEEEFETEGVDLSELISFITQNQVKENYTFEVLEDQIGFLSYNSCTDKKGFKKFLKQTFKRLKKENINQLIIDIRANGGGNSSLNDLLLSYITKKAYRQSSGRYWKVSKQAQLGYQNTIHEKSFGKKFMKRYLAAEDQSILESEEYTLNRPKSPLNYFKGNTCFLIGPNTFSSANFLADAVKTYQLSTLIGVATGEYTNDFGEQLSFALPHSGHYIYVSSTYDIGTKGNFTLFEPVYPDIKVEEKVLQFAIDWMKKTVKSGLGSAE